MARFIDHAAALDVEIVDDWLFLYGRRAFSTLDPATWAWLFSVVGALLDKFAQWSRWRDERSGDGCRGRGIRHVIVSRRHGGNRSALHPACCAASTSARGGAARPPSHSALRMGQWSVRRRLRGDLAVPADLGRALLLLVRPTSHGVGRPGRCEMAPGELAQSRRVSPRGSASRQRARLALLHRVGHGQRRRADAWCSRPAGSSAPAPSSPARGSRRCAARPPGRRPGR